MSVEESSSVSKTASESEQSLRSTGASGTNKEKAEITGDTSKKTPSDTAGTGQIKSASKHGIGWFVAATFIVAELVGGGVVAMPVAFIDTGLIIGTVFMVTICGIFVITGYLLADIWETMRERWPEYCGHCRKPFPEMGRRSMGDKISVLTKMFVYTSLFGTTVVYILLSSKIFQNLLASLDISISFCWFILIVTAVILPITFLKSPADYWQAIVVAVVCTLLAITMIFIGVSLDFNTCYQNAEYSPVSFNAILSLGIFLFAFNGHQVFPTVQNDMRHPKEFKKSVIVGFFFVAILYMPLSIYSFLVYGSSMTDSVIDSIQTSWIRSVADLAIAIHCILTVIITINPVNLQLEDTFNVPHRFCFKRVLVRTSLLLFAAFVGLSIPNFGAVMNLFGSTTVPATCIVLPCLFYMYIKAATYDEQSNTWIRPKFSEAIRKTPIHILALLIIINVITIICSIVSTLMAIDEIINVRFTPPCYVLPFVDGVNSTQLKHEVLRCCGKYMNISRLNDTCSLQPN